jgi:hypothetical protein
MTEELERTTEKNFRANYKQNTKGIWTADFTVRGDGINELKERSDLIQEEVLTRLTVLNLKGSLEQINGGEK